MWLMAEKAVRGKTCHSIYRYVKANNKYMKDYTKKKESSHLQYWNVNNLYGWALLQKLPVNDFEWVKDTSQFNENFKRNYNEESDKGYFLEITDNVWGVDLADIQLINKVNERIRFRLCVIDIYSKCAWVLPLKYKKALQLPMLLRNFLKESNRKSNKIWVDKRS